MFIRNMLKFDDIWLLFQGIEVTFDHLLSQFGAQ